MYTGFELTWDSGASSELDDAFVGLWEFLEAFCSPENRLDGGWTEDWLDTPEDLLNMYNSVLGNE